MTPDSPGRNEVDRRDPGHGTGQHDDNCRLGVVVEVARDPGDAALDGRGPAALPVGVRVEPVLRLGGEHVVTAHHGT